MTSLIITQTPLRISFFGGGTDFPEFYRYEEGCVLSTAINKYIYVNIKDRFDDLVRVGWTKTELVSDINAIEHELVREALRLTGLKHRVEISTMADIPSAGSGLGSSSAVTVGVLNAIHTYLNQICAADTLAQEACQIEINALGKPIGKQDQYIVSYGGLRFIRFSAEDKVVIETIDLGGDEHRRFSQHLMLFYTGLTRRAETILSEQQSNISKRRATLRRLREFAYAGREFLATCDYQEFGNLLHESWQHKKELASQISNPTIEAMYETARRYGAIGGKITGAGGGGFLLLWCPPEMQDRVRAALAPSLELPVRLEPTGSKVIFNYSPG